MARAAACLVAFLAASARGQISTIPDQDIVSGCENTCPFARDSECDDGGPGSFLAACRLGTDCADCGARNVSSLPVRELGFRAHENQQPAQGLGGASGDGGRPADFIADATFEQCAAMCGDGCQAIVRRDEGTNCWLIPSAWFPSGDVELVAWSGGTTYVRLPDCDAEATACTTIWGAPCDCEEYGVKNTFVHEDYEYATLDDMPAQQDSSSEFGGQRCPNGNPACAGSTCSRGTAGQNYFLKMPCGWDFFEVTSAANGYSIWNDVVTQGWGTHCINDPFTGAAFWTFGENAGYQDDDLVADDEGTVLSIRNECGQMHSFVANGAAQIGWYMELDGASGGFRSTSCGRRFLIRRPLGCVRNVPNQTVTGSAGGPSTTETSPAALDRLALFASGGTASTSRTNRALTATAWDTVPEHVNGDTAAKIIDGEYGGDNQWSAATESENRVDQYIYVGLRFDAAVLIDSIAFGRDNSGVQTGGFVGTYTVQVSTDELNDENDYEWLTVGTLIYTADVPGAGSDRHAYRLTPPTAATALRIIVNTRLIAIDELEVYGMSPLLQNWQPENSVRIVDATLTDSAGFEPALIGGPEGSDTQTATGASVSVNLATASVIYAVSFRSTDDAQFIRRCKLAYLNMQGQLMYSNFRLHSTNPADAEYILDISTDSPPADMRSDDGETVALPVPIETTQLRFYDIEGQDGNPVVSVQFGLWGHAAEEPVSGVPGDPRLAIQVEASGFDDKVGCDTVLYSITVRHAAGGGGQNSNLAQGLRISDMLSDSKVDLVNGTVQAFKSTASAGASADWQPINANGHTVVEGNGDGDALVIVDVDHLYMDEVILITYTVFAKDPAPKDIISTRAVVELLDSNAPCLIGGDTLVAAGTDLMSNDGETPIAEGSVQPDCVTTYRPLAWHEIASDVGALAFSHNASNSGGKPFEVTIDGLSEEVYLINVVVDATLIAGTANNVMLSVAVPTDRARFFELLSIDNVDNNARTGTSEDDTVLKMDLASVMTSKIQVPCIGGGAGDTPSTGIHLELTGALYNSFYYSGEYACGDNGCNELQLEATLEYDLLSSTIFHARYTDDRLLNVTRGDGFELPIASLTEFGVRYTGGNPTWPLLTINLGNDDLPAYGYEGTASIAGDFSAMTGRLSIKVSGGSEEYFVTRSPVTAGNNSCGATGKITGGEKISTSGNPWDVANGVTGSKITLSIKALQSGVFISADLDGHLITMMIDETTVNLGQDIFLSIYKEVEADSLTLQSVDASFRCNECTVRHSELHKMQINRPGVPPNDISLNAAILTGACGNADADFDACVVERAEEGVQIANISVVDIDWTAGDTYSVQIVEQDVDGLFRLSSNIADQQGEVWLEVGAERVPARSTSELYSLSIRVQDNVWADHFFMKTFTVNVLAYPDTIELSTLGVIEAATAGTEVATISSNDPDTDANHVTYTIQGDGEYFEVVGRSLRVGSAGLPDLATQAFFEISVTATDWNGLSFSQDFRLFSIDINECLADDPPCALDNLQCANIIGGYTCVCDGGYQPETDETGTITACVDILECDGGDPCGAAGFVTCTEQDGGFDCADVDECQDGNNGDCGVAEQSACTNIYGAPPVCSDVCECDVSDTCSGVDTCTNYDRVPATCAGIEGDGYEDDGNPRVEANTAVSISLSGNIDPTASYYAVRRPQIKDGYLSSDWQTEPVNLESSEDGSLSLSLTPTTSGLYYVVVTNFGRSLTGTPHVFTVVPGAASSIEILSSGLVGGPSSADSYAVVVRPKDEFDNYITDADISQDVLDRVGFSAFTEDGTELTVTPPSDTASDRGAYTLQFVFNPRTAPALGSLTLYTVGVEWDGTEVATSTFALANPRDLQTASNFAPANSTLTTPNAITVAGETGTLVVQCRTVDGIALMLPGGSPAAFRVVVDGPTAGQIVRLSNAGNGQLSGEFGFDTAGRYSISVIYETQDADGNIDSSTAIGDEPLAIDIIAGDVAPALSTASGLDSGPFPFITTVRPAIAGMMSDVRILPRDVLQNENRHSHLDDRIGIRLTPRSGGPSLAFSSRCGVCNSSCVPGTIRRDANGAYVASYRTEVAGLYDLSVEIDGTGVNGFPITVDVAPATAVTFSSTALLSHFSAIAGTQMEFPLVFSDVFGNVGAFPGGSTYVELVHAESGDVVIPLLELRDRKLWTGFTCALTGVYNVRVKIDGAWLLPQGVDGEISAVVIVSPGVAATGTASTDLITTVVTTEGTAYDATPGETIPVRAGELATVDVDLLDENGNRALGASNVLVVLSNTARTSEVHSIATFDDSNGLYRAILELPESMDALPDGFFLTVFANGESRQSNKLTMLPATRCTVQATPITMTAGELSFAIDVQTTLTDVTIIADFTAVGLDIDGSLTRESSTGTSFQVTVDLLAAAEYMLSITVDGDDTLCRSPFPITVTSAEPSTDACALNFDTAAVEIGSSFEFSISASDANGNAAVFEPFAPTQLFASLENDAGELLVSCVQLPPGTTAPPLDDGVDQCYLTAELTAVAIVSSISGTVTIRSTLNTDDIPGSPATITVTPLPDSGPFAVEFVRPQGVGENVAGMNQHLTFRIQERSTGIVISANLVTGGYATNVDISSTCCSYCSCQQTARTDGTIIDAGGDSSFHFDTPSMFLVGIYDMDLTLSDGQVVHVPAAFEIVPDVAVASSFGLTAIWEESAKAGQPYVFTLQSKDIYGNAIQSGGDMITAVAYSQNEGADGYFAVAAVLDNQDGTYTATMVPTHAGDYFVEVERVDDGPIPHDPWRLVIDPSSADPALSQIDATQLAAGIVVVLPMDVYGNSIVTERPGLVFAYNYQFDLPAVECGGESTANVCEVLSVETISADPAPASNIDLAVDGDATSGSGGITYLTDTATDSTVTIIMQLQDLSEVDRLRVTVNPDDGGAPDARGATMSFYSSMDGEEWTLIEGLVNGYYGTELLPEGVTVNPSGPSDGAPQIATLATYVDVWSVMFPSRLMNYFRIDLHSDQTLGGGYAVREMSLMNCRCAHGGYEDSGLVTWDADAGGWLQNVDIPLPLPTGRIRLVVKNGALPIGYTDAGSDTGIYMHLVGRTGDQQMACAANLEDVRAGCCFDPSATCEPEHCSENCAASFMEWQGLCMEFLSEDPAVENLLGLCQHASTFDPVSLSPSFFVPSKSPGLATSVFAGEPAIMVLEIIDGDSSTVAVGPDFLASNPIEVLVSDPDDVSVEVDWQLEAAGAIKVGYLPISPGVHSITVMVHGEVFLQTSVPVRLGRAPNLLDATLSDDTADILLTFDQNVDISDQIVSAITDCGYYVSANTVVLLGSASTCTWKDARTFVIHMASDATIVAGDELQLLPGIFFRMECASTAATGSRPLKLPANPTAPQFCIPDYVEVGGCESLLVNARCQSSTAGRPLSFEYTVHSASPNAEAIAAALADQTTEQLSLDTSVFTDDSDVYQIYVRATNFAGVVSDEAEIVVQKSATERLPVTINAPSVLQVSRSDFVFLSTVLDMGATCFTAADDVTVSFQWSVVDGPTLDFGDDGDTGVYIYIPPSVLVPGARYVISVVAADSEGRVGEARLTIDVRSSDLIAIIDGGDRTVDFDNAGFVLDAGAGSFDPDTAQLSLGCDDGVDCPHISATYEWRCKTQDSRSPSTDIPCFDRRMNVDEVVALGRQYTIDEGTLDASRTYEFSVLITAMSVYNGIKIDSAAVKISPATNIERLEPAVKVSFQFSQRNEDDAYVVSNSDELTFVASEEATSGRALEFAWQLTADGAVLQTEEYSPSNRRLVVPAGLLPPDSGLKLTLSCKFSDTGGNGTAGVAQLDFVTSKAPSAGTVQVTTALGADEYGTGLDTSYTFDWAGWVRADWYQLFYLDCSNGPCMKQVLTGASINPSIATKISAAPVDPATGVLTIVADTKTASGATVSTLVPIYVLPNTFECTELGTLRDNVRGDLQLARLGGFYQLVQMELRRCPVGAPQTRTRVRWANVNETCTAEMQQSEKPLGLSWSPWAAVDADPDAEEEVPIYEDETCTDREARVKFQSTVSTGGDCVSEAQERLRENNGQWGEFDGTYTEDSCYSVETRVAWNADTTANQCESVNQFRIFDGLNYTDFFAEDGTFDASFVFPTCTQVESRIRYEADRSDTGCTPVEQQRSNSENAGWGDWEPAGSDFDECTEVESRARYQVADASCVSNRQTQERTRLANNGTVGDWSDFTPEGDPTAEMSIYVSCIEGSVGGAVQVYTGTEDPVTYDLTVEVRSETRDRFESAVALGIRCRKEVQGRLTGTQQDDQQEWSEWSGTFTYVSCAEADAVEYFSVAETSAEACARQMRTRTRECFAIDGDEVCIGNLTSGAEALWRPEPEGEAETYIGDFEELSCQLFETRQMFEAGGFNVQEDLSSIAEYQCVGVTETRRTTDSVLSLDDADWLVLDAPSDLPFSTCAFEAQRVRWMMPFASGRDCTSQVQTRSQIDGDNQTWTSWSGSHSYAHCTQRQTRYRYSSQDVGCVATVEERWRVDGGIWVGDEFVSEDLAIALGLDSPYDDCPNAQPQQRVQFLESKPHDICRSEVQQRARGESDWEEWVGTMGYSEEVCIVEETRTRWNTVPMGNAPAICLSEVQRKYRVGHALWSEWSGDYTDETCETTRVQFRSAIESVGNCTGQTQLFTGSGDGTAIWGGDSEEYNEVTCQEYEEVVRWNAPISWAEYGSEGSCLRAVRTRRRQYLPGDPVEPWGEYSAETESGLSVANFIYESCVMYEQREFFNNPAGDPSEGGVCKSETQKRWCTDCSEDTNSLNDWGPWDGSEGFLFPFCQRDLAASDSGFSSDCVNDPVDDNCDDISTRLQFQTRSEPCVSETQIRIRLPVDGQQGEDWTPWTGDYVYARCPFTGEIQSRSAWLETSVVAPTECIPETQTRYQEGADSWSEWIGDFQYVQCTETETRTFYAVTEAYNTPCVSASQIRTRVDLIEWSGWSGDYNATSCIEIRDRTMWANEAEAGDDVCESEVQSQMRALDAETGEMEDWPELWLYTEGVSNYTAASCTQNQERTRWSAGEMSGNCTYESQTRERVDGGVWTGWTGSYGFEGCYQNDQRTRYDSEESETRCNSEVQTRQKAGVTEDGVSEGLSVGAWGDGCEGQDCEWTGTPAVFQYLSCTPTNPTVETRIRWRDETTEERCRSEVQQRTVSSATPDPDWSGTYAYLSCTLVEERFRFAELEAPECELEQQTRTQDGATQVWAGWSGAYTNNNCTEWRDRWEVESSMGGGTCTRERQERIAMEDGVFAEWSNENDYSFWNCTENEEVLRWESNLVECTSEVHEDGDEFEDDCGRCTSETRRRSRLAGGPDWSSYDGTFIFEDCQEIDLRRRYQYLQRSSDENCTLSSESQSRSHINNGDWEAWSGSEEFFFTQCGVGEVQMDTPRVRWYEPTTDDTCLFETQVRIMGDIVEEGVDPVWGEWGGTYIFSTCTQSEAEQRYQAETSSNTPCLASTARRESVNGGNFSEWASEYEHIRCVQTDSRTMWLEALNTEGECTAEEQTRSLDSDVGLDEDSYTEWDGDFEVSECVQLQSRVRWQLPTASSDESCVGESQNRSRTNNAEWGGWDGSFVYDACEQTQTRLRYQDAISADGCAAEEQTRRRDGLGEWGRWTGTYEEPDCVQPGEQSESRIRYVEDESCTVETQTRTRNNGGPWSEWLCSEGEGEDASEVECAGTTETCLETVTLYKYVNVDSMCVYSSKTKFRENSGGNAGGWSPFSDFSPVADDGEEAADTGDDSGR